MQSQQPYLIPLPLPMDLTSLAHQHVLQNAQLGKMAQMPLQQNPPPPVHQTQFPQFQHPAISLAQVTGMNGFNLANAGMYHSLSPLGQVPGSLPMTPTILTNTNYGGVTTMPKIIMPSVKVRQKKVFC